MGSHRMSDLSEKVALVTGTSPNIGGALASGLAAAGAVVACNDIDAAVAKARAAQIESDGGTAVALPFDVTDHDAAAAAVNAGIAIGHDLRVRDRLPGDWR